MRTPSYEWTTYDEKRYFKYIIEKYAGDRALILSKLMQYKHLMFVKEIRAHWGVVDKYRVRKVLDEYISAYTPEKV